MRGVPRQLSWGVVAVPLPVDSGDRATGKS